MTMHDEPQSQRSDDRNLAAPGRWHAGVGRADITVWRPGLGMMGWGMLENYAESVATPLSARAFVLRAGDHGPAFAMVCCELAFISLALHDAVTRRVAATPELAALGLARDRLLLLATHTHSGPGGFTHYPFYNVTIPGFAQEILDGLADGITAALAQAAAAVRPATLRFDADEFAPELPVAFNRVVHCYNRNPDVTPVTAAEAHLAIDRRLRLLRIDDAEGTPIGSINWFAVHCTSVHSDNHALHFDNKGHAAAQLEHSLRTRGIDHHVGAFAQGAAGDVTPNRRRHPGKPFVRGELPDDDASARLCGGLQAELARKVLDNAARTPPLSPRIACAHAFVDMSRVAIDPRFVGGREGLHTSAGEIGMAMFFGTEEGPGLPRRVRGLQQWFARARAMLRARTRSPEVAAAQAEKLTWVESTQHRVLGLRRLGRLPALRGRGRTARAVQLFRALEQERQPWTPQVLPVQLVVLGELALAAVPHEFTTVAGRRLCRSLAQSLAAMGVHEVVLAGYANAYAGYVTTPEEYEVQEYEGASTHFGKWTLPAYQSVFERLAARLLDRGAAASTLPEAVPPAFTAQELAARAFT